MKTVSMSGSLRENVGKKDAKRLRNEGKVPCVVYGGEKQMHIAIEESDFRHLVYSPEIAFVELTVDGKVYKAILQDIQFHPVTDSIYHADFVELVEGKPIVMGVPVKTEGLAVGVTQGGKLMIKLRKIKVKSLPEFMPESITVNVEKLSIGQSVKIKEIELDNVELLDSPNAVAVTVRVTRAAASARAAGLLEGEEETAAAE